MTSFTVFMEPHDSNTTQLQSNPFAISLSFIDSKFTEF